MDKKLKKKIKNRKEEGTLRSLSSFDGMIDLVSNDYLGLKNVQFNDVENVASTGSRLISGNSSVAQNAESDLASFFGWESGLCFNSGYDANLAIFSALPQKGDVVLYDEHIHASVRDGIRLSHAKAYSFKHNDVRDLERLLAKFKKETIYIAIEGIYSMHGDISPIAEILELIDPSRMYVIIDEAHSCGVIEKEGKGISSLLDVDDQLFIKLVTFGKGYGGHGACVLADQDTKEYLINFARPFIYTTALPDAAYSYMSKIARYEEIPAKIECLKRNIKRFREEIKDVTLISDEQSPIQVIRYSELSALKKVVAVASEKNIAVKLVQAPTVKKGEECIRVCLHATNIEHEIIELAQIINENIN